MMLLKLLFLGGADRILVVGAESAVCGAGVGGFAAMKALSTRNDDPKKLQDHLIKIEMVLLWEKVLELWLLKI